MEYEVFLSKIKEQVSHSLGAEYTLTLQKVQKNNGLILDGLCILHSSSHTAPAIYLNSFYSQFLNGRQIEDITDELLSLYRTQQTPPECTQDLFEDYALAKDKIACRLVHAASNASLLSQIPHIKWLDLAIVFYLCVREDENGLLTSIIYEHHLNSWKISLESLYQAALSNTIRLFPPVISSLTCLLEEILPEGELPVSNDYSSPFYVLTNRNGLNGAICILYPEVLKNFAKGMESDLIILPSSIHEVLLLPDTGNISYNELKRIVSQVNCLEVPAQDRLSNQVYLYSRKTDSIFLALDTPPVLS